MKVRFFNFSKRSKETMFPTTGYTEVDLVLKDSCDVEHPTFLIQSFNAAAYNYFYIPDWNRYYFITAAKSIENMWEVTGTEDYLGSFKSEIGAIVCDVLYASGSTKNIADSRIPVKANLLRGHEYKAIDGMTITEGQGAIVLGITGKGSFGPYLMKNSTQITEMLDGIENWSSFITDNWTFTKQLFFGGSASECLRSAIAIPLVFGGADVSNGTAVNLNLGHYPATDSNGTNIQGYHITKPLLKYNDDITIPWQSNDWKRLSEYTSITLYLPLIGLIDIPATTVKNDSALHISYSINVTSGDIAVEIYGKTSGIKVTTASGNCAMPTAYGSTGIDTNKLTSAVTTGAGTLMAIKAASIASGPVGFAAQVAIGAGLAATAGQTIDAIGGNGSGSGGLGGGANQGLDKVAHIWVAQKDLTDTQANLDPLIGKPFMGKAKPSDFSGFVQTEGFQFKSNRAYLSEIQKINELMDSGIYYT